MSTSGFEHLGDERIHRSHAFELVVGRYRGPDGDEFTRDVVRHRGAVGVLPLHDDGTVTLVRQYRAPLDREVLEIPAGIRDVDGEPPEETARRELAEEVGLGADTVVALNSFHNAVGYADELVQVFLATGLHDVPSAADGPEEQHMTIVRLPVEEALAMVASGEITDAKTVIALLLVAEP